MQRAAPTPSMSRTQLARRRRSCLNRVAALAFTMLIALSAPTAQAEVLTEWNQAALEVVKAGNMAGNPWSRAMAMVHVTMSDAINAVQGRYTRYVATTLTA